MSQQPAASPWQGMLFDQSTSSGDSISGMLKSQAGGASCTTVGGESVLMDTTSLENYNLHRQGGGGGAPGSGGGDSNPLTLNATSGDITHQGGGTPAGHSTASDAVPMYQVNILPAPSATPPGGQALPMTHFDSSSGTAASNCQQEMHNLSTAALGNSKSLTGVAASGNNGSAVNPHSPLLAIGHDVDAPPAIFNPNQPPKLTSDALFTNSAKEDGDGVY